MVKVGVSSNPKSRFEQVERDYGQQVINSFSTGFVPSSVAYEAEKAFQEVHKGHRAHGEFFTLSFVKAVQEVIEIVADHLVLRDKEFVAPAVRTIPLRIETEVFEEIKEIAKFERRQINGEVNYALKHYIEFFHSKNDAAHIGEIKQRSV